MKKIFEDYFSELQADMISICLEYVKNQGDNIYVYCSHENNTYSVGYFYKINGKLKERHKISEELSNCDDSIYMQKEVMKILMNDLQQIEKVCNKNDMPMPTEIKLLYDIKRNSLDAKYRYDIIYSNHPTKTADNIEQDWFDEIEQNILDGKS